MCRCIESIKLEDGKFYRLKFHQERVNKAFQELFPQEEPFRIFEILNESVFPQNGVFKCRIVYNADIQGLEFVPYTRKEIRLLKLIDTNIKSSAYKLADRREYDLAFSERGECDDVLLVRNGLLTDSSYCNIALFDGMDWFTPRLPLLWGTNRAELLNNNIMQEKDILVEELINYKKICLFNAMIEFGELVIPVENIYN